MTTTRTELLEKMAADRIEWLKRQIAAQDILSEPCAPGGWRWADVSPDDYKRRKTEAELSRDRAIARTKATAYRQELAILESE